MLFFTSQEAAEWATSGTVAPPPNLSRHAVSRAFSQVDEVEEMSRDVTPKLTLIKGARMSLAEASRAGVVPLSAVALRQAKRPD